MVNHEKHPFSYSIRELAAICHHTTAHSRESYVGLFTRIFSIRLTRLLLCTPLTPNIITSISVFFYFVGLSFFYGRDFVWNMWGCFFIFVSIVLDGCDGEIARFRKKAGVLGGRYVEPVSHDVQYGLGFLFVAVLLFLRGSNFVVLVLGALAGITKLMTRLLRFHFDHVCEQRFSERVVQEYVQTYHQLPFAKRLYDWFEKNLFSSTSVLLLFFIATLVDRVEWVMWYYGIGYSVLWMMLFVKQVISIHRQRIV